MRSIWKFFILLPLVIAAPAFFVGCGPSQVSVDADGSGDLDEGEDEEAGDPE